jgi:ribose transport system permease protein
VILAASVDLSVAALISASAVLASVVVVGGSPAMILPAVLAVLVRGAFVAS